MAMQQSGKGASGSGPNPALSDEQADQFAASFTPAWDTGEADDAVDAAVGANATLVAAAAPVPASAVVAAVAAVTSANGSPAAAAAPPAAVVAAAPAPEPAPAAPAFSPKQTLIGTAPQANAPSGGAPPVPTAPKTMPLAVSASPGLAGPAAPAGEGRWQEKVPSRPPPAHPGPAPAPASRASRRPQGVAGVSADPFRARPASTNDDLDVVPKKSSKSLIFVVAGLAVAAGLGLFLKFALSEDAPKTPPAPQAMGPAATTAEIPLPPPKVDPPAATTTAPVATTAKAEPPPAALPPPRTPEPPGARPAVEPHAAAAPPPVAQPRQPRAPAAGLAAPPPAAPPAAAAPKTPPKGPDRGIVRDNPF